MKTYENFNYEEYNRKLIIGFLNEIRLYKLPENIRSGIFNYDTAIEQAKNFLTGKITLTEIKTPDNVLRNMMLLWGIDKQKCEKIEPDFHSQGKVKNMEYHDGLYTGYLKGWTGFVLKDLDPEIYMSKFKAKGRSRTDEDSQCIIEIIDQKANVYLI